MNFVLKEFFLKKKPVFFKKRINFKKPKIFKIPF